MKPYMIWVKWILVVGGVLWGYEGLTGNDLVETLFGNVEPIVDIVIGAAGLILGYHLLTMKKK